MEDIKALFADGFSDLEAALAATHLCAQQAATLVEPLMQRLGFH